MLAPAPPPSAAHSAPAALNPSGGQAARLFPSQACSAGHRPPCVVDSRGPQCSPDSTSSSLPGTLGGQHVPRVSPGVQDRPGDTKEKQRKSNLDFELMASSLKWALHCQAMPQCFPPGSWSISPANCQQPLHPLTQGRAVLILGTGTPAYSILPCACRPVLPARTTPPLAHPAPSTLHFSRTTFQQASPR